MLMQVSLDDVRPYASFRAPDTDNNLIILDNFRNVAFTGKTLQLGFIVATAIGVALLLCSTGRRMRWDPAISW